MYNIAHHYNNVYSYLKDIIADARVLYLHPFGSTQPENIEIIRNDIDPPNRRGPLFIFYDQEPLHSTYNQELFAYIKHNTVGPHILVSTERDSKEKDIICERFGFAHMDYFFHIFAASDWYRGCEFDPNIIPVAERQLKSIYITLNRLTSNERVYRSLFVNELYKNDLLDFGYVSYSKDCPDGGMYDENLRKGIDNLNLDPALVEEAIANISAMPDLRIDFEGEAIPNQSMLLTPTKELMSSFLFVVTETCYWQKKTHLTEKIFKPIALRMPFILLGCQGNLQYLRDYGFITFGDFWDEGYDAISDPIERMRAVTEILNKLKALSEEDLMHMLLSMQPILDHNYKLFTSGTVLRREWQHLIKGFHDISRFYEFDKPHSVDLNTRQAIPVAPSQCGSIHAHGTKIK
jgi:hypothetical protein